MNESFLGFGPLHWGIGLALWLGLIVAILVFYLGTKKNKPRDKQK